MFLDEATSNLDSETEQKIINNIFGSFNKITIVSITHKLINLKNFDEIIVLDKGKIVNKGSYQEILNKYELSRKKILGIVGLGYVGLPLAYEFSKHFEVIGFDINETRVSELKRNFDENKEFSNKKLKNSKINYSFNPNDLKSATYL